MLCECLNVKLMIETDNDDSQKLILTLLWSNFTLSMGQGKYCASSASGQLPT